MLPDLASLRDTFGGAIITTTDPRYEGARVPFNARIRTRPAVIAQCSSTEDVAAAVRFAREAELPVAVRGAAITPAGSVWYATGWSSTSVP